jgi:hypothetical protein
MPENRETEIHSPDHPEIEQQNIPEFEQSTVHPQRDDPQARSDNRCVT